MYYLPRKRVLLRYSPLKAPASIKNPLVFFLNKSSTSAAWFTLIREGQSEVINLDLNAISTFTICALKYYIVQNYRALKLNSYGLI